MDQRSISAIAGRDISRTLILTLFDSKVHFCELLEKTFEYTSRFIISYEHKYFKYKNMMHLIGSINSILIFVDLSQGNEIFKHRLTSIQYKNHIGVTKRTRKRNLQINCKFYVQIRVTVWTFDVHEKVALLPQNKIK